MTVTRALPDGYRHVALGVVESTNDEAKRLAARGAPEGTLVTALQQTKGRGRHGSRWLSGPGNLYMSLIVRPSCSPARSGELAFVATLALGDALGELLPSEATIGFKWPNDVLVRRRKIAGILLEASTLAGSLEWVVLGVGVNVAWFPEDTRIPATSLLGEGVVSTTAADVMSGFAAAFGGWYASWRNVGFAPVRSSWLERAEGLGETITVRLGNECFEGRFSTLDEAGALVAELAGGMRRRVAAGEVFLAVTQ